jgi:hypothetical protein
MKVGFYSPHLCLRGTTVAMYDYAYYNQEILNNESYIFYDKNHHHNHPTTIEKFSVFNTTAIESIKDLDKNLLSTGCDAVYIIKGGYMNDGRDATACKTLIHAIAPAPETEQHGDIYAYGSYWLSNHCSEGRIPAVPYMVDLPKIDEDLRVSLGIPQEATVFGRNGGLDTWDLPFADKVVHQTLQEREDVYFLFQNTPIGFTHRKILHLPSTSDMVFKTKFINTCDAMIHCRYVGESFGLSCAEFSIRNKPVITWNGSPERNHIEILGGKGLFYSNEKEMRNRLISFHKEPERDWNCYKDYTPEKIMKIFDEVYLK